MIKLIQITDTHINSNEELLYDIDTTSRLKTIIDNVNKNHINADFCIFTGDISDDGSEESYIKAKELIDSLEIPYIIAIGNHDNRSIAMKTWSLEKNISTGKLDQSIIIGENLVLILDTSGDDTYNGKKHSGNLNDKQIIWIEKMTKKFNNYNTYIFMHHPPFDVYLNQFEGICLDDLSATSFRKKINTMENIKHIFFGHIHRQINGRWNKISFSSAPSTAHHLKLSYNNEEIFDDKIYGYSFININGDEIIIHTEEIFS